VPLALLEECRLPDDVAAVLCGPEEVNGYLMQFVGSGNFAIVYRPRSVSFRTSPLRYLWKIALAS
jgi:hypothetical protein